MRLTDEQVMQDNKRFANCNALAELKYCGWDIPQKRSITNDEIHFYAWLCRSAVALLKEQEEQKQKWLQAIADTQLAAVSPTGFETEKEMAKRTGEWNGLRMAWEILTKGR